MGKPPASAVVDQTLDPLVIASLKEPDGISSARILMIDDQQANIALLERVLCRAGFTNVMGSTHPTEVLALWDSFRPDILLLDLNMPELGGFGVMKLLQPKIGPQSKDYVPILVLTADATSTTKQRALTVGAKDFLTKPFDHAEVVLRVKNMLETRLLHVELKKHNQMLETRVRARTSEIWDAVTQLEQSRRELRMSREETVHRLSIAAEFRDDETARHIQRMSRYCALLARLAGWDIERTELIRVASQMHDLGKIGIPDSILLKPRTLTPDERAVMQTHAEIGHQILADSDSELLRLAASIALTHHERIDGAGYPSGLHGDEIPIEGRLAAIADVYDALTSDRVYRRAFSFVDSIKMMREGRGTQFDPEFLDLFLESMDEVLKVKEGDTEAGRLLHVVAR
jgi:putative two-component system response regulator